MFNRQTGKTDKEALLIEFLTAKEKAESQNIIAEDLRRLIGAAHIKAEFEVIAENDELCIEHINIEADGQSYQADATLIAKIKALFFDGSDENRLSIEITPKSIAYSTELKATRKIIEVKDKLLLYRKSPFGLKLFWFMPIAVIAGFVALMFDNTHLYFAAIFLF